MWQSHCKTLFKYNLLNLNYKSITFTAVTTYSVKALHSNHEIIMYTRVIPKVSGLDILDNNIFHNLYTSKTYILYKL